MAEAVIAVSSRRISDYLIQDPALFVAVSREMMWLRTELQWMRCFVKDAEQEQQTNKLMRSWVCSIRDIAWDIDDVLDTYVLSFYDEDTRNAMRSVTNGRQPDRHVFGLKTSPFKWRKGYNFFRKVREIRQISMEIESIKERLVDATYVRKRLGIENRVNRTREVIRSMPLTEKIAVGFEDVVDRLAAELVNEDTRGGRLVISIYGMGGLGKTTLAQELYNDERVRGEFEYRVWLCVTRDYNIPDLLLETARYLQITIERELEKLSSDMLAIRLYQFLKGHTYLLVLDDVWERQVWESLKPFFPDTDKSSKVIITTRVKEVAIGPDSNTHSHQLRLLNLDQSLLLFRKQVYAGRSTSQRLNEDQEKEMVERCRGLPIAIVSLARLLSTQTSKEAWQHLMKDHVISHTLTSSFDVLSHPLKSCFCYLGLFPEESLLDAGEVIRLWVAEGLIEEDDYRLMEDVATGYLNELDNRCLIQVEKTRCGRPIKFRVLHYFLWRLAVLKGKEMGFVRDDDAADSPRSHRHLAIDYGVERYLSLPNHSHRLRTFLSFEKQGKNVIELAELLENFSNESKLLKVLNISGYAPIKLLSFLFILKYCIIPEEIGTLIHLRYLGIKNVRICKVPSSIRNLRYLQTLDFLCHPKHRVRLPLDICKLIELRHLLGDFIGPVPIDNLTELQTLKYVSCQSWIDINPEKLVNLRELCIRQAYEEKNIMEFHFESFMQLQSLQIFSVVLSPSTTFNSLRALSYLENLIDLTLRGKMEKLLEDMHILLPKLQHLSLQVYNMRDDPMATLKKFPYLMELELNLISYEGPRKMVCTPDGFPQLETLTFMVSELEELQVDEGAMPWLSSFKAPTDHKFAIPERLNAILCYPDR